MAHTITIQRDVANNVYTATYTDPAVILMMDTDTLPTPDSACVEAGDVLAAIAARNADTDVVVQLASNL